MLPITSLNFASLSTAQPTSKGKGKATKQDDDKWEREQKGLKPINQSVPPPPSVPQPSNDRNAPKRTSRPSTSKLTAPLPLPLPPRTGKRILATQEEQDEWAEQAEQAEQKQERQGSKEKKQKTSNSTTSTTLGFKPITSFKRSTLPAPPPILPTSKASPLSRSKPQPLARPAPPRPIPSKLSTSSKPLVPNPNPIPIPPSKIDHKPPISLLSQSSALYSALKNPQAQIRIKSESKPLITPENSRKLMNTIPTLGVEDKKGILGSETEMEDGEFEWESPKKKGKNGGYLPSGMASRASSILSAIKTDHTLWLHDLSRKLLNLPPTTPSSKSTVKTIGSSKRVLGEALQPDLRLIVLEVLSPSPSSSLNNSTDDSTRRGGGGGNRTLLARCRLDLSCLSSPLDEPSPSSPEPELDQDGLVLFSLHHRTTTTSSFSHPQPVPPQKQKRQNKENWNLYVPLGQGDLKTVMKEGSEVWVFGGGFGEVELNEERESWRISSGKMREEWVKEEEESGKREQGEVEMEVRWELRGRDREEEEARRKKRERVKKGLVVTKFGILV